MYILDRLLSYSGVPSQATASLLHSLLLLVLVDCVRGSLHFFIIVAERTIYIIEQILVNLKLPNQTSQSNTHLKVLNASWILKTTANFSAVPIVSGRVESRADAS